jgi:hypothetical protein
LKTASFEEDRRASWRCQEMAFPIRVSSQKHRAGLARGLLQIPERFLLPGHNHIGRLVGVTAIDTEALSGQVAHVPVRSEDPKVLAQEFFQSPRFRGRLDDDEVLTSNH